MPLGKTWWHGAIVKRQDSYVVDEAHPRARFDEAAWEATAAWEAKRWPLNREATEWLKDHGAVFSRKGDLREDCTVKVKDSGVDEDLLLIAVALILME